MTNLSEPNTNWQTDFLPLLVLSRRGVVPINIRTCSTEILPLLVQFFGEVSALQYCTGSYEAPTDRKLGPQGEHKEATPDFGTRSL